jgi:hypothetical protein
MAARDPPTITIQAIDKPGRARCRCRLPGHRQSLGTAPRWPD